MLASTITRRLSATGLAISLSLAAAYGVTDSVLATPERHPAVACTIGIDSGGASRTYAIGADEERQGWAAVPASDFVRATSGPCHFLVYDSLSYGGNSIALGSDLSGSIRAGVDGVTNRGGGGGGTWLVRSLVVYRRPTTCRLNIGGNGVRMNYYADTIRGVPAMDRVWYFVGGDCGARVWSTADFGDTDPAHRFKALHPAGTERGVYDPGFRIRSLTIWDDGNACPVESRDQGRCLPQATLSASIFDVTNAGEDRDQDGLDDLLEDSLAQLFSPVYYNHSSEDATRTGVYTDASGDSVTEPVTIFQVHPAGAATIEIRYMKLWLEDRWGGLTCGGHRGDSQQHSITLRTPSPSSPLQGRFWVVAATSGGARRSDDSEPELGWSRGDRSIRGVHFVRGPGERGIARHLAIYFSKGKHHEYADAAWSGQRDKACRWDNAYVDGRGAARRPPLPVRIASLRAPAGRGDRFGYNNVGTRSRQFFNDLASHGFPAECVWDCGDFYEADPSHRAFR